MNAIQNMRAAMLLFGGNPLSENFRPLRVQNDTFNFGAAEVDADAILGMHFRMFIANPSPPQQGKNSRGRRAAFSGAMMRIKTPENLFCR
jgi:hypothetical protein